MLYKIKFIVRISVLIFLFSACEWPKTDPNDWTANDYDWMVGDWVLDKNTIHIEKRDLGFYGDLLQGEIRFSQNINKGYSKFYINAGAGGKASLISIRDQDTVKYHKRIDQGTFLYWEPYGKPLNSVSFGKQGDTLFIIKLMDKKDTVEFPFHLLFQRAYVKEENGKDAESRPALQNYLVAKKSTAGQQDNLFVLAHCFA